MPCWLPGIDDVTCLEILRQACDDVGNTRGVRFRLGLDIGAADLWIEDEGVYWYALEGKKRSPDEHARHIADLIDKFDLF